MVNVKERLKLIATEAAQRAGVSAVTFRELGKAVGIKSSSVIYHFKNKDGLLLEITKDYTDHILSLLKDIDRDYDQANDKLEVLINFWEGILAEGKFCLCGMLASDINALDDKTNSAVQQYFDALEKWIAGVIKSSGKFDAQQANNYAKIILSSIEGAMLLDKVIGQPKRLSALRYWVSSLLQPKEIPSMVESF